MSTAKFTPAFGRRIKKAVERDERRQQSRGTARMDGKQIDAGSSSVIVRITSAATDDRVFNCEVGTPATDVTPGTMPAFTASDETGYFVNDDSTSLSDGTVLGAMFCGEVATDGKRYFRAHVTQIDSACAMGGT